MKERNRKSSWREHGEKLVELNQEVGRPLIQRDLENERVIEACYGKLTPEKIMDFFFPSLGKRWEYHNGLYLLLHEHSSLPERGT